MSAETLCALAGVVMSLAFSYVPELRVLFDRCDAIYKRAVVLGVALALTAMVTLLWCAGVDVNTFLSPLFPGGFRPIVVYCTWTDFVGNLIAVIVASQATYTLTPRKNAG